MDLNLIERLSETEIEYLSILLDVKYNIMTLTELHGFFTAILSSPVLVKPSEWMPYILLDEDGNERNCSEDFEEFQEFHRLIFKFYNQIISDLNKDEDYKIISFEHGKYINIKDASEEELEYWCSSYIAGTYYGQWSNEETILMLVPFAVLAKEVGLPELDDEEQDLKDIDFISKFKDELSDTIQILYDINNEERLAKLPKTRKINNVKKSNKIGRNDLCVCGSEKKYKKCCANIAAIDYH